MTPQPNPEYVIPESVYTGITVEELPSGALRSIIKQEAQYSDATLCAVEAELAWRDKHDAHF